MALIFHDLCSSSGVKAIKHLQIKYCHPMSKYLLVLFTLVSQSAAWAGWQYLTNNNGSFNEYYFAPIENKGKVKVMRTFTPLPIDAKVPYHTPKAVVKVMLYNYASEQSTYEINCQEQTIQLMTRIFYRDGAGKIPFITHQVKDDFIQGSTSEFSKQFIKTPLHLDDIKHYRMAEVACK
jgi:hypothetical protein